MAHAKTRFLTLLGHGLTLPLGYTLLGQDRQTDQFAVDFQKHLRVAEAFLVVEQLFLAQALEVFYIWRSGAEEERAGDDVVEISIFIPERPVEWKAVQFSLFVADQSNRLFKGIDGLNVTANDLSRGSLRSRLR